MKYIKFPSLVLGFNLLAAACSPSEAPVSAVKEAIDKNSDLSKLGLKSAPSYDQLIEKKSVKTATTPWTDTYWPLDQKSLARRWPTDGKKIGLGEYFSSQVAEQGKISLDPTLSPADKYDILFRHRHGIEINNETLPLTKITEWAKLEGDLDLSPEVSSLRGFARTAYKDLGLKEFAKFRGAFPLSSDGWNTYLKYASNEDFLLPGFESKGEDWSWMGSCHGWAAAALMEETPKHGVMAKFVEVTPKTDAVPEKKVEREVWVSEGDIRGLLTKAWADNAPGDKQFFLGRRCNENIAEARGAIPHGENGRGFYGEITRGVTKQPFYVNGEIYVSWISANQRVYPLNYSDSDSTQGYMLETYRSGAYEYVLAKDLANLEKFFQTGDVSVVEVLPSVKMFGCWDVNPASYHVALMEKIGKEGTGLVMDRTRTGQVWNQPVYGADFKIGELMKASDAPLSNKRSSNAYYLATVTATISWISEPASPEMSYPEGFDLGQNEDSVYTYVLEFDRKKNLIGGEWGTLDNTDPKQVTPDFIYGFEKGSKPQDSLRKGFDYTGIIEQLHKCSLEKENSSPKVIRMRITEDNYRDGDKVVPESFNAENDTFEIDRSFKYSDCVIEKI